jgi:hypothetical protein
MATVLFHGLSRLGIPVVCIDRAQRCARVGALGPHRVLQACAREVAIGSPCPFADHRAQELTPQSLLPRGEFGPFSRMVMALHRLTYSRENRPLEALSRLIRRDRAQLTLPERRSLSPPHGIFSGTAEKALRRQFGSVMLSSPEHLICCCRRRRLPAPAWPNYASVRAVSVRC